MHKAKITCVLERLGDGKLYLGIEGCRYLYDQIRTRRCKGKAEKYYVSFYWDSYKHWANWVGLGTLFEAKRTRQYQFSGRGAGRSNLAQELRMGRASRAERGIVRRHGKSLY